jgi:hypothetical protein
MDTEDPLSIDIVVDGELFRESVLESLHQCLVKTAPAWAEELWVDRDEDAARPVRVWDNRRIREAIWQASRPRGGLGFATLLGADAGLRIFLNSSSARRPVGLNHISVELIRPVVSGEPSTTLARSLIKGLISSVPVLYGRASIGREFRYKNTVDGKGRQAIGVDLAKSLPGIYWLNYFGRPYVEMFGKDRLLSAPAHKVGPVAEGVLIELAQDPSDWELPSYRAAESALIAHLGESYFFSRFSPERATVAPAEFQVS